MTANALGAVSPAVYSDECRQSMMGADQIVCLTKKKELKRTLREMTLQSNGSWMIISQVYSPNITMPSLLYISTCRNDSNDDAIGEKGRLVCPPNRD